MIMKYIQLEREGGSPLDLMIGFDGQEMKGFGYDFTVNFTTTTAPGSPYGGLNVDSPVYAASGLDVYFSTFLTGPYDAKPVDGGHVMMVVSLTGFDNELGSAGYIYWTGNRPLVVTSMLAVTCTV